MSLTAALFAGACNQVYGLDPTTIREVGIDAPPDLEDEDLDTIANEFDNCPGLPNTDQADRDGDQVGDTCDRFVDSPTEHIEARLMFNRPALDADDWSGSGWEFREGHVIQPTFGGSATMFMNRTFQGTTLLVEARMAPVAIDRNNIANKLALVMEGLGGDECFVTSSFTGSNGLFAATAGNSVGNGAPAIDDNVAFVLRASSVRLQTPQVAPSIYCSIGAIRHGVDTLMKIPGPVGISVKFASARIDYVVVYSSAAP